MKETKSASVCFKVYREKREKLEAGAKVAGLPLGPFVEAQVDKVEPLEQQVGLLETRVAELMEQLNFYESQVQSFFEKRKGQTAKFVDHEGEAILITFHTVQDVYRYFEALEVSYVRIMRELRKEKRYLSYFASESGKLKFDEISKFDELS